MSGERAYSDFASFWPFYLREHSKPATRALHYVGTTLVVAIAVFALATGRWGWLIAMPLAGYFFAWIAHFRVERNRQWLRFRKSNRKLEARFPGWLRP